MLRRVFLTLLLAAVASENIAWSTGKDGGAAGAIFVADTFNNAIRRVDVQRATVSTIAGGAGRGFSDGIGSHARFFWPRGIAVDAVGAKLYVADMGNGAIRRITLGTFHVDTLYHVERYSAEAASVQPKPLLSSPTGLSTMGDTLFVATYDPRLHGVLAIKLTVESEQAPPRVHVRHPGGITTDGKRVVFATSLSEHAVYSFPITAFSHSDNAWAPVPLVGCDGSRIPVHRPQGIAYMSQTAASTSLFVADYDGGAIVRLALDDCPSDSSSTEFPSSMSSRVRIFVSRAVPSYDGHLVHFSFPRGVAVNPMGQLFVSNSGQTIEMLDLTVGTRLVLAGAQGCGLQDGAGAQARFWLARGCPWVRTQTGPVAGGDGDGQGCTPESGCKHPTGQRPRLLVVHTLSRSGSTWLMHLLSHSPMIYVSHNCVPKEAEFQQAFASVAGSFFRGGERPCGEPLMSANSWADIMRQVSIQRHLSRFAYPRPIAASFKIIAGARRNLTSSWSQR